MATTVLAITAVVCFAAAFALAAIDANANGSADLVSLLTLAGAGLIAAHLALAPQRRP